MKRRTEPEPDAGPALSSSSEPLLLWHYFSNTIFFVEVKSRAAMR